MAALWLVLPLKTGKAQTRKTAPVVSDLPSRAVKTGNSPYDDPRIVEWSKAFLEERCSDVIAKVEADLGSGAPHPYAPMVWARSQASRGTIQAALSRLDPRLRAALGDLPSVFLDYEAGKLKTLLKRFPPEKAGEVKDPQVLAMLFWSAANFQDFLAVEQYALALLRRDPNSFHGVWAALVATENDERVRFRMLERIRPEGEFAGTVIGEVLKIWLAKRPLDDKTRVEGIQVWLKQFPNDEGAFRFLGFTQSSQNDFAASQKSQERGINSFPFAFAADEVPKLARGLGGIQRPLVSRPKGVTFDIGRFTGPERDQVPLARLKPVILRPRMENLETDSDDLDFEKALRSVFNQESLSSRGGTAVYIDVADDYPGAITPKGRYTVSGDAVTVTFTLIRDKKKIGQPIIVTCRKSELSNCPKLFFDAISEAVSWLPLEGSKP
jgi:hypothetical protein